MRPLCSAVVSKQLNASQLVAVLSTRGGSIIYNNNAWEFDGMEVLKLCEFISGFGRVEVRNDLCR